MHIPLNGRIAIVDNNIEQALPLMQLFSRQQYPYVFYKGDDQKFLPEEGKAFNDIRILFLDINLIDEGSPSPKQIKSTLYSVIKRVICDNNYPYLLIYWSRHESEHSKLVEELFANELKNICPISFLQLQKSDYFDLGGNKTALFEEKIPELIERIRNAINKFPVYSYLMAWENLIHSSADNTLSEIFKISQQGNNWDITSNYLFYKLGN